MILSEGHWIPPDEQWRQVRYCRYSSILTIRLSQVGHSKMQVSKPGSFGSIRATHICSPHFGHLGSSISACGRGIDLDLRMLRSSPALIWEGRLASHARLAGIL